MAENKDIHRRDDFTDEDYKTFEKKLFSPSTPVSELETICMTLAHLPTKRAQDLLALFKESDRAHEVKWLDMAVEEGEFHYLSPQNAQEERDYLALKVMQEIWDELVELEIKFNEATLNVDKMEIEHEAIRELVKKGAIDAEEELGLDDAKVFFKSKAEELHKKIELKEKIYDQIKESIKTERYKDVDPMIMKDIHFG